MESIIISNRINNNTGLKQTDTTGLLFRSLQGDHRVGWKVFFVFQQDSISYHVTAGSLSREITSCASVLPMTGCLKSKGQNKTKKYSLEEDPEEFYNSNLKKKKILLIVSTL